MPALALVAAACPWARQPQAPPFHPLPAACFPSSLEGLPTFSKPFKTMAESHPRLPRLTNKLHHCYKRSLIT